MLVNGIYIMITGMGVVFAFLLILIAVMQLSASSIKLLNKYSPEPIEEKGKLDKAIEQNQEIAVVVAAVKAYIKG